MIPIKSKKEIAILKESNQLVAGILEYLKNIIRPGITTKELDVIAENIVRKEGAIPAFKGYKGYPATICTSINEEVVHGIPTEKRILKEGDIISIDLGVKYKDYYGDATISLPVGKITDKAKRLLKITEEVLYRAIKEAIEGNHLFDISWAIQSYVEREGFNVVRSFVGHGIGKEMHEEPQIPNFGNPHTGPLLREGMVLAIEPMVNEGTWKTKILDDHWTAVTLDGSLSCHFEHTIAITKNGPVILSKKDDFR